ncbi:hypothetical protein Cadr_000028913 [Camelus dromedarius]|uniref:Uncharacterized protein n=1 Tax=Camelus dromedarius TaxID=9838 RepID=A0A5N4C7U4_CAMDR|nr:hypothetical protein Cadr_000028913 [Camelus dromedarius]
MWARRGENRGSACLCSWDLPGCPSCLMRGETSWAPPQTAVPFSTSRMPVASGGPPSSKLSLLSEDCYFG